MKKPTTEQKARAAERRERMQALAKAIAAMPEAERAALAAKSPSLATIEGRALSPFNACLIVSQKPDAVIVGGFRQWINAGRAVRKGEHGLALWVPVKPGEDAQDDTEAPKVRFVMGTVFDISQTDELTEGNRPEPVQRQPRPAHTAEPAAPEFSEEFTQTN